MTLLSPSTDQNRKNSGLIIKNKGIKIVSQMSAPYLGPPEYTLHGAVPQPYGKAVFMFVVGKLN